MPYYEAMANEKASRAVRKVAAIVGSQAALARRLVISIPTVNQWATGKRPVPSRFAPRLEEISGGKCPRKDFRPDDWQEYWPDPSTTTNQPKPQAQEL